MDVEKSGHENDYSNRRRGDCDLHSDEPADELLCELGKRMREADEDWVPDYELEQLRSQSLKLTGMGIYSYSPKAMELFERYVKGAKEQGGGRRGRGRGRGRNNVIINLRM